MAVELPANPPSFSGKNPFRLVWEQPEHSLEYFVDGRTECIHHLQYRTFQRIFEDHTLQEEHITNGAAAEVAKLSRLSEDGLAELWEIALRATCDSSSITSPPRQGHLTKNEFFVLLSELRIRLAIPDEAFANMLLKIPESALESPRARSNPFRHSMVEFPVFAGPPLRRPPTPPEALDRGETDLFCYTKPAFRIHVEELSEQGTALERRQSVADGYTEYARHFGTRILAAPSLADTPEIFLPPIMEFASLPLSSDKEVGLLQPAPVTALRQHAEQTVESLGASPFPDPRNLPDQVESVAQAVCELDISPSRDRWDANDFGRVSPSSSNHNSPEINFERSMSRRSRYSVTSLISPSIRGRDAPIRTAESDLLAEQRLMDLTSRLHRQPSQRPKRNSIGSAISLVRKKTTTVKRSKLNVTDPDQAPNGFSYPVLAEALQDAVAEGNMALIASLFNLGANVNYSSVKDHVYHNILQVAVASGHWQMVDYFLKMGADGLTVDSALTTAFFANNLDLAIKLVPHADVYHLQPFDSPGPAYQKLFASSLGRVARDRTMPQESRRKLLEFS